MSAQNQTIMHKIAAAEEEIKAIYERIGKLKEKLKDKGLSENKKDLLRREIEEVRKLLATHDDQLNHLRSHNRNTFVFVVLLCFVCFSMYMIYVLVRGNPLEKIVEL